MTTTHTTIDAMHKALEAAESGDKSAAKLISEALKLYREEKTEQEGPDLAKYREAAQNMAEDGHIEVDETAIVSKGDEEGAYVAAWLWVADENLDEE